MLIPGILGGKFEYATVCLLGSCGEISFADAHAAIINNKMNKQTTAALFFFKRLHESWKKFSEGAAIFSLSAKPESKAG